MIKEPMIKYPKLLLVLFTFIIAYLLFYERTYQPYQDFLISLGYFGTFFAGMMYSYNFTAAPATAIFLILGTNQNIFLAAIIGGSGALIGDMFIFNFVRHSLHDEISMLLKNRFFSYFIKNTPTFFKKYLLAVIAGLIIASPLPDEVAVVMLSLSKSISFKTFSVISLLLNTAGIFIILNIGGFFG